jgi:excisionase family DNA binding protein
VPQEALKNQGFFSFLRCANCWILSKTQELSETLEIGLPLAYNLVRRKDFPSIKLGREYRVFADALPKWMEKQKRHT